MARLKNRTSNKPGKRKWTTPEQKAWMEARMDGYMEAKSRGSFVRFWPAFYRDWFEAFPAPEPTDDDPMDSKHPNSDEDSDDGMEGGEETALDSSRVTMESSGPPKACEKGKKKAAIVSDIVQLVLINETYIA